MDNEWKLLREFDPGDFVIKDGVVVLITSQENLTSSYTVIQHPSEFYEWISGSEFHHTQESLWKLIGSEEAMPHLEKRIQEQEKIVQAAHEKLVSLHEIKRKMQPKLIVGEMYQLNGSRKYALVFHTPILSRFVSIEINHSGPHNIEEKRYHLVSMAKLMNEGKIVHLTSDEDRAKAQAILTIIGNDSQSAKKEY